MAKYDKTQFYWLQLKEDFFDEGAIEWLEEQPNGKKYSLFYLKLCLKSLRTNGILIRRIGEMLLPYDHIKLGELTKTDPDTVLVAMELLTRIGLVKKLENGELYMTQVENMIGSQSIGAFKKQQARLMKKNTPLIDGGQKVDICPIEIDKEKEIEIDIDKEKEEKKKTASRSIALANDIYSNEFDTLWKLYPKKQGKSNALKAYIKARKNGTTFEEVKQGIENYCKQIKAKETPTEYIKHGSTWFNGECWTDEPDLSPINKPQQQSTQRQSGGVLADMQRLYDRYKAEEELENATN